MSTNRLLNLYHQTSKHSNYQILPTCLQRLIPGNQLETRSRWEKARLDFMIKHHDFRNETVLDIGGNTGYFSFEILEQGAKKVLYFEGNPHHSEFVLEAAKQVGLSDRICVANEYFTFEDIEKQVGDTVDSMLLLNVLHHTGDDYGDSSMSKIRAMDHIARSLIQVSAITKHLVFQLGFNWKGNPELPLFTRGTKQEMIDFVRKATKGVWNIENIGIAVGSHDEIKYEELSTENVARNDSLGEFLNRPLFLMTRTSTTC